MAINGHQLLRYSMMASDGHRIFINGLLRSLGSRHLVRCCKCKRFTSLLYSLGHRCPVRDYGQRPPRHRPCRVSRPTSLLHTLGYRYHVWGHKRQRPTSLIRSLGRRRQVWGPGGPTRSFFGSGPGPDPGDCRSQRPAAPQRPPSSDGAASRPPAQPRVRHRGQPGLGRLRH